MSKMIQVVIACSIFVGCADRPAPTVNQRSAIACALAEEERTFQITRADLDRWFANGTLGRQVYQRLNMPATNAAFTREASLRGHTLRLTWDPTTNRLRVFVSGLAAGTAIGRITRELRDYNGTVCEGNQEESEVGTFAEFCADVFGDCDADAAPDESLCPDMDDVGATSVECGSGGAGGSGTGGFGGSGGAGGSGTGGLGGSGVAGKAGPS